MSSIDASRILNELTFHVLNATEKNVDVSLSPLAILEILNIVLQYTSSAKLADQIGLLLHYTTSDKLTTETEKMETISNLINSIVHGDPNCVTLNLVKGICIPETMTLENLSKLENMEICRDGKSIKETNEKVEQLTENRMKNYLNEHNKPKSGITLFNIMHLKAEFCNIYRPNSTEIMKFHVSRKKNIKIAMLTHGGMVMYNDDKEIGARVMYHSFGGCSFNLFVIVPINKFGLMDMEKKLTVDKYNNLLNNMRPVLGSLTIPKLSLTQVSDLSELLKTSGLTDLFDSSTAILNKITNSTVAVDHFIQGISMNITEFGSNVPNRPLKQYEICASCCGGFTSPPEEQSIVANEPFLLIVNYEKGNSIISINRIVNPVASL